MTTCFFFSLQNVKRQGAIRIQPKTKTLKKKSNNNCYCQNITRAKARAAKPHLMFQMAFIRFLRPKIA